LLLGNGSLAGVAGGVNSARRQNMLVGGPTRAI
jgi:hypothetical protein